MDAPTIVAAVAAGAVSLKILADLTHRHLAVERVRLRNEAHDARVAALSDAPADDPPGS